MTEKRFTIQSDSIGYDYTVQENGKDLSDVELIFLLNKQYEENQELKQVLGKILLEVKKDISNYNQTGEVKVFINPNSFNLISEVLRKYGALKDWYE